jgi:predicted Zn-ribbon and HTH transcriptional regulator
MAQCKMCEKKGIFVSINDEGLCAKCASDLKTELSINSTSIEVCETLIGISVDPSIVFSQTLKLIKNLSVFLKYDSKYVRVFDQPVATRLIKKINESNQKIVQIAQLKIKDAEQKIEELETERLKGNLTEKLFNEIGNLKKYLNDNGENYMVCNSIIDNLITQIKSNHNYTLEIKCPYCGFKFEEMPQRKRKCPECKSVIYIVKADDDVILMTEDQHKEHQIINNLNFIGVTRKEFEQYKVDYYKKFGERYNDFLWSLYNSKLNEEAKVQEFSHMGVLYYLMADIVKDKPAQYLDIMKRAKGMDIYNYTYSGVKLAIGTIPTNDSCENCKKLSEKIFTIKEALKILPLPHENCTHPQGCRCIYSAIAPPDSEYNWGR